MLLYRGEREKLIAEKLSNAEECVNFALKDAARLFCHPSFVTIEEDKIILGGGGLIYFMEKEDGDDDQS